MFVAAGVSAFQAVLGNLMHNLFAGLVTLKMKSLQTCQT